MVLADLIQNVLHLFSQAELLLTLQTRCQALSSYLELFVAETGSWLNLLYPQHRQYASGGLPVRKGARESQPTGNTTRSSNSLLLHFAQELLPLGRYDLLLFLFTEGDGELFALFQTIFPLRIHHAGLLLPIRRLAILQNLFNH